MASPVNGLPSSLGTSPVLFPGSCPRPRVALPTAPVMGSGGEEPYRLHPARGPESPPPALPPSAPGAQHGSPGARALRMLPVLCCSDITQPGGTCFSPAESPSSSPLPSAHPGGGLAPQSCSGGVHLGPSWLCCVIHPRGSLAHVTNHCRFPRSEHPVGVRGLSLITSG